MNETQNQRQDRPQRTQPANPAMANVNLPKIAGIIDKPAELGGRTLNPKEVAEGIVKVLVSITNVSYEDVFSVRVLHGKDGNPPEIILQVKEKAIRRQSNNPDSWISSDSSGMKIDRSFTDALLYTFFVDADDITPRKIKFKDQHLVEYKLDTEVVAALLCNVSFDDLFLKVEPLRLGKKEERKNKRVCGLLVRYSIHGLNKGFSRDAIVKYMED